MTKKYNFLVVGAGLYGCAFAYEARKRGFNCLVIDKRPHVAGNCYTKKEHGITVHSCGAHIFHTNDEYLYNKVCSLSPMKPFVNTPIAIYKGNAYNLPFNMNTFSQLFGVTTPYEARAVIESEIEKYGVKEPKNLEEKAISLVGKTIYEKLVKGYSEKQWGRKCSELPSELITRLPVRFTYDNNYFNDKYQAVPEFGYTHLCEKMLDGVDVMLSTDFFANRELENLAEKTVFTGKIDQYFEYSLGKLEYRSLNFYHRLIETQDRQGVAVVNFTGLETPFTRRVEHKHFLKEESKETIVTYELPKEHEDGENEPMYPVNNEKNNKLYRQYTELAKTKTNVFFRGRLGTYRYLDMGPTISLAFSDKILDI